MKNKEKPVTDLLIPNSPEYSIIFGNGIKIKVFDILISRKYDFYHSIYNFKNLSNINSIEIYYEWDKSNNLLNLDIPQNIKDKIIEYIKNKEEIEKKYMINFWMDYFDCWAFIHFIKWKIHETCWTNVYDINKINTWEILHSYEKIEWWEKIWHHYYIYLWNWFFLSKLWEWPVCIASLEELWKYYSLNHLEKNLIY